MTQRKIGVSFPSFKNWVGRSKKEGRKAAIWRVKPPPPSKERGGREGGPPGTRCLPSRDEWWAESDFGDQRSMLDM